MGNNEVYNRENLVGLFLVHKPPPHPQLLIIPWARVYSVVKRADPCPATLACPAAVSYKVRCDVAIVLRSTCRDPPRHPTFLQANATKSQPNHGNIFSGGGRGAPAAGNDPHPSPSTHPPPPHPPTPSFRLTSGAGYEILISRGIFSSGCDIAFVTLAPHMAVCHRNVMRIPRRAYGAWGMNTAPPPPPRHRHVIGPLALRFPSVAPSAGARCRGVGGRPSRQGTPISLHRPRLRIARRLAHLPDPPPTRLPACAHVRAHVHVRGAGAWASACCCHVHIRCLCVCVYVWCACNGLASSSTETQGGWGGPVRLRPAHPWSPLGNEH